MINSNIFPKSGIRASRLAATLGAATFQKQYTNEIDSFVVSSGSVFLYPTGADLLDRVGYTKASVGDSLSILSEGKVSDGSRVVDAIEVYYKGKYWLAIFKDYSISAKVYSLDNGTASYKQPTLAKDNPVIEPTKFYGGGSIQKAVVTAGKLNVRAYPSETGKVVGSVGQGTVVDMLMEGNKRVDAEDIPSPYDPEINGPPTSSSKTVWAYIQKPLAGWVAVKYKGSLYIDGSTKSAAPKPSSGGVPQKQPSETKPKYIPPVLTQYGLGVSEAEVPVALIAVAILGVAAFAMRSKK